jgi:hypothetical protein
VERPGRQEEGVCGRRRQQEVRLGARGPQEEQQRRDVLREEIQDEEMGQEEVRSREGALGGDNWAPFFVPCTRSGTWVHGTWISDRRDQEGQAVWTWWLQVDPERWVCVGVFNVAPGGHVGDPWGPSEGFGTRGAERGLGSDGVSDVVSESDWSQGGDLQ